MRRLFLSDVHLSPRHPERGERLLALLAREAGRIGELYLLGDLFDYWIGPKHLDLPDYRDAFDAMRGLSARGVRVVFLCGNRDFYVRRRFRETLGLEVFTGPVTVPIGGGRAFLCHGDHLCTRDRSTRRAQAIIRSRPVEEIFTRLPVGLARFLALGYRGHSHRVTTSKPAKRKALADEAVLATFRAGADVIVCGHIHRPGKHIWRADGRERVLYVLGDWSAGPSYLTEEDGRWRLYGAAET
jgi:UDP-2,3-diacylglucosamine hydrolase